MMLSLSLSLSRALFRTPNAHVSCVADAPLPSSFVPRQVVLNKPTAEQGVDEMSFVENEVYAIDILVSTGEGKPKILDEKETTVYKRALDREYQLKMKTSRALFSEINRKYPALPFTLRAIEDQR